MSHLKIVVAGSRSITGDENYALFVEHMSDSLIKHRALATRLNIKLSSALQTITIISGGAKGVDQFAKRYANENAFLYREFKPLYKRANDTEAPKRRNLDMAKEGQLLVAMWNNASPGTRHMIDSMKRKNKPVYLLVHR